MCLYGYSLFPFVPALLLCIIPFSILQWIVVLEAMVGSVLFLMVSIKGQLGEDRKTLVVAGVAVGVTQLLFTLLLKLMFVTLLI